MRLDDGKFGKFSVRLDFGTSLHSSQTCPRRSGLANNHEQTQSCLQSAFIWRMSVKTIFQRLRWPIDAIFKCGAICRARPLGGARQSGFACSVLFWHSYACSRAGFLRPWPFANPTNLSLSP